MSTAAPWGGDRLGCGDVGQCSGSVVDLTGSSVALGSRLGESAHTLARFTRRYPAQDVPQASASANSATSATVWQV
jgi:hypothetical protein